MTSEFITEAQISFLKSQMFIQLPAWHFLLGLKNTFKLSISKIKCAFISPHKHAPSIILPL